MRIIYYKNEQGETFIMRNKLSAVFGVAALSASMLTQGVSAQWIGGYEVNVNGKSVGVVENAATVRFTVAAINDRLTSEYGYEERINPDIKLKAIIVSDDKISEQKDIYRAVASLSDKMTDAVRIVVDGEETICVKDQETMNIVIDRAVEILSGNIEGAVNGTVQLIGNTDVTVIESEVYEAEDAAKYLAENGYITVQSECTTEIVEEYIPEAVKVANPDMYEGEEKVIAEGINGTQIKRIKESYINAELITQMETVEITDYGTPATVEYGTKKKPGTGTGSFMMPAKGRLTSPYGARWGRMHKGIDIAAPAGTPVYAADTGVVICSEYKNSFGNIVKIDHKNGFVTYYAHNSQLLVKEGDVVTKGQLIAKMGSTGRSTGSHCHFEVLKDGVNCNPLSYVK